jgi:hypothetical protein
MFESKKNNPDHRPPVANNQFYDNNKNIFRKTQTIVYLSQNNANKGFYQFTASE